MPRTVIAEEESTQAEVRQTRKIALAAALITERMDSTQLVIALVAAHPELEDILPDDPQLKRDIASVRDRIADRQPRPSASAEENAARMGRVVEQHIHIHLWDEKTGERIRTLGVAVMDLLKTVKDRLIEAKKTYIDGDDRDVITFGEAVTGFRDALRGMSDFMTRRDRSADAGSDAPPTVPTPWGPTERLIDAVRPQIRKDVVRLASGAVGDVLDANLEPVKSASSKTFKFGSRPEPELDEDDYLEGPPAPAAEVEDDAQYVVRSTTPHSPHYVTSDAETPTTYSKAMAAQFGQEDAERVAGDWSDHAATKGFSYRYQVEEAGMGQAQKLHAGASLSH